MERVQGNPVVSVLVHTRTAGHLMALAVRVVYILIKLSRRRASHSHIVNVSNPRLVSSSSFAIACVNTRFLSLTDSIFIHTHPFQVRTSFCLLIAAHKCTVLSEVSRFLRFFSELFFFLFRFFRFFAFQRYLLQNGIARCDRHVEEARRWPDTRNWPLL